MKFFREKRNVDAETITLQEFKQKIIDSLSAEVIRINGIDKSIATKNKEQTFIIQGNMKIECNSANQAIDLSFILSECLATLYLETGRESVWIKLQSLRNKDNMINLRVWRSNLLVRNLQNPGSNPDFLDESNNPVTLNEI